MMRLLRPGILVLLAAFCAPVAGAAEQGSGGQRHGVIAVLPVQNRGGDDGIAEAVGLALREGLAGQAAHIEPGTARPVLRRLRIRNSDHTPPALLKRLAGELGAGLLISATLHDAERRGLPRLAVSARVYSGTSGELLGAAFEGGSGLDGRKLLGLGKVAELEELVPQVMARLNQELADIIGGGKHAGRSLPSSTLGTVAIVPLDSNTERRSTANAETATEAARAALHRRGVRLASPGCAAEVIRLRQAGHWGGVVAGAREALRRECGADAILTGTVEAYGMDGLLEEPEPRVSIALRIVDSDTGRILWMDALDRKGWDGQGLFGIGRIHARGALAERLMDVLSRKLLASLSRAAARDEEKG